MSDTCIVCLGDLGGGGNPDLSVALKLPSPDHENDQHGHCLDTAMPESGQIAHLLPCGHNLHDECLKPWVERANSCPICRQSFNVVELLHELEGPVISSYIVEDRVQVADIDPSMIIDDLADESEFHPCPICGHDDNEAVLMICDGCEVASHTYCVGLDAVPHGDWFCCHCETQRPISAQPSQPPRRTRARANRRTRADQRTDRSRNQVHAFHWARVWQSVWDQLNLDLDFPFEDEQAAGRILQQSRRDSANQREFRAWEHRFRIAERQGGSNRLREAAPVLLEMRRGWPSRPRPRIETPEPESLDEVKAWNAFERAKEIEDGPGPNRRKRKSPTTSPVEPTPAQPERKFKRPRTKRPEALADILDSAGESSSRGRQLGTQEQHTSLNSHPTGPSFLQSLLKEVEESSTPNKANNLYRTSVPPSSSADMGSSGPSSPVLSPLSSSRSSSRPSSITPPPHNRARSPISPTFSEAAFSSPEFSPSRSPGSDHLPSDKARSPRSRVRPSGHLVNGTSPSPSRSRSDETSPTRGLSLSAKSDLQKMVRATLKPFYISKEVSKEEYTDINRRISRLLYDQVDSSGTLDSETKSKLAVIASNEVNKAVSILRELRANETTGANDEG